MALSISTPATIINRQEVQAAAAHSRQRVRLLSQEADIVTAEQTMARPHTHVKNKARKVPGALRAAYVSLVVSAEHKQSCATGSHYFRLPSSYYALGYGMLGFVSNIISNPHNNLQR